MNQEAYNDEEEWKRFSFGGILLTILNRVFGRKYQIVTKEGFRLLMNSDRLYKLEAEKYNEARMALETANATISNLKIEFERYKVWAENEKEEAERIAAFNAVDEAEKVFQKEKWKLLNEIDELKKRIATKNQKEVDELKKEHRLEIDKLKHQAWQEQEKAIKEFKNSQRIEIEKIEKAYQKTIDDLRAEHLTYYAQYQQQIQKEKELEILKLQKEQNRIIELKDRQFAEGKELLRQDLLREKEELILHLSNQHNQDLKRVRKKVMDQFIAENLLQDDGDGVQSKGYDRNIYDELVDTIKSFKNERNELSLQKTIAEMQQLANDAKRLAEDAKAQREWQRIDYAQHSADMTILSTKIEGKLKDEEVGRERQKAEQAQHKAELYQMKTDVEGKFKDDEVKREKTKIELEKMKMDVDHQLKDEEMKRERQGLAQEKFENKVEKLANDAKLDREWQKVEQSQHLADIHQMKNEIEGRLKDEEINRERQNIKIDLATAEISIQRREMMIDFGRMQNELAEVGLSLKEFVMQKAYEFQTYEIQVKENILKMGEMVNWVNAERLESERSKMEIMERLGQMGLALKEHHTYLERTLLGADRLKLEAEKQNLMNREESMLIRSSIERFNMEYGTKRNELERLMIKVEEGKFNNHAQASLLSMDEKVLDIQTQLKGLTFEQVGLDLIFREGQMNLSQKANQIAMMKVQLESKMTELKQLRERGQLENRLESERLKNLQKENSLQDEINHLHSAVDSANLRSEYLRNAMNYLRMK